MKRRSFLAMLGVAPAVAIAKPPTAAAEPMTAIDGTVFIDTARIVDLRAEHLVVSARSTFPGAKAEMFLDAYADDPQAVSITADRVEVPARKGAWS